MNQSTKVLAAAMIAGLITGTTFHAKAQDAASTEKTEKTEKTTTKKHHKGGKAHDNTCKGETLIASHPPEA